MTTDINLSIVAAHDELRRCTYALTNGLAETGKFLFVFFCLTEKFINILSGNRIFGFCTTTGALSPHLVVFV